jgi:hypothetical protein
MLIAVFTKSTPLDRILTRMNPVDIFKTRLENIVKSCYLKRCHNSDNWTLAPRRLFPSSLSDLTTYSSNLAPAATLLAYTREMTNSSPNWENDYTL